MEQLMLGIDVGTTAIKYSIYNKDNLIDSRSSRITTYSTKETIYQNPQEILEQIKFDLKVISELYPQIVTIGLSTAMHTLIPVIISKEADKMYIWSDNSPKEVLRKFKEDGLMAQAFYHQTGTPIHSMSPFAKLLYFKENDIAKYHSIDAWFDLKSYLMNFFTSQSVIDFSLASAMGLFNLAQKEWDQTILDFLALDAKKLPRLVHPKTYFPILPAIAKALGLSPQVEIMVGSSDGCLSALGSYNQTNSPYTLTLGTSGAVRYLSSKQMLNEKLFCYYLDENQWVIGGPTNNGGIVLEWLSQLLFDNPTEVFKHLTEIKKCPDLFFIPYLQGERAPFWDEELSGEFIGLKIFHQRNEIIQATLEGILFNLKLIFELVQQDTLTPNLVLNGGVFQNPIISQMMADILGLPCLVTSEAEPSQGLKELWLPGVKKEVSVASVCYLPNEAAVGYYQSKYEKWVGISKAY